MKRSMLRKTVVRIMRKMMQLVIMEMEMKLVEMKLVKMKLVGMVRKLMKLMKDMEVCHSFSILFFWLICHMKDAGDEGKMDDKKEGESEGCCHLFIYGFQLIYDIYRC
jgi:hypothetical protein